MPATTLQAESSRKRWRRFLPACVVLALCLCFAGFNLTVAETFDAGPGSENLFQSVVLGCTIGIVIGQINLISIWAAMAVGRVAERLPWSIVLTVLLWYSIILGSVTASPHGIVDLGIILVAAQVVAQIPLWIGSQVFRRKLTARSADAHGGQFSLRDMMVGIFLLAVALSMCRRLIPEGEIQWSRLEVTDPISILILVALAVANQVTVVPCIWAAFRPRRQLLPVLVAAVLVLLLVTGALYGVMNAILGPFVSDSGEAFQLLAGLVFGQSVTVAGTLLVLRLAGFQIIRVGR
jgi:hypothetical protein